MAEEQPPNNAGEADAINMHDPLFPAGYTFSQDTLEQWVAIPPEEPLIIGPLSRGALDQFLFSISDIAGAVAELRLALIDYSNGKLERANRHVTNSTTLLADGETRNRLLFDAIMKSAIQVRQNAGK